MTRPASLTRATRLALGLLLGSGCVTAGLEPEQFAYREQAPGLGVDFVAPGPGTTSLIDLEAILGGGLGVADLTGDGRPDLVATSPWGPDLVYRAEGAGFVACPALPDERETYAVSIVELDGDGLRDLVLLDRGAVRLFRNLGDCTFEEQAPLYTWEDDLLRPMNAAWADFDGDNRVDVHIAMRSIQPLMDPDGNADISNNYDAPDVLLRGLGGFGFEDISARLPIESRVGHGFVSSWADIDRDGRLDLLVGNDHGRGLPPNQLLMQQPDGGFLSEGPQRGFDQELNAMGLALGDIDNDGSEEMVWSDTARLFLYQLGPAGPVEAGSSYGLGGDYDEELAGWAVALADLDHDRDLDLLAAWGWKEWYTTPPTTNELWAYDGAALVHLPDALDHSRVGGHWRTALPADLDGDGQLELLFSGMLGPISIQRSSLPPEGNWLSVSLEGPPGNADGLGARVEIEDRLGPQQRRICTGCSGVHSSLPPVAHFGLGPVEEVDVRVFWPDGSVSSASGVAANQYLSLSWGG